MGKKPSGKQAAIDVLREHGEPMLVKDLVAEAVKRTSMKGKTPTATIAAQIYTGAKKGETFRIVKRGVVELLPDGAQPEAAGETEAASDPDSPAVTLGSVVLRDGKAEAKAKPDPKPEPTSRKSTRRRASAVA